MKRFLKILVVVILLFGIYCVFLFFVPHGSARRKLAEYKKQLIAQGEKLDLASHALPRNSGVSNMAGQFLAFSGRWFIPHSDDFSSAMKLMAPGAAAISYTNLDAKLMASYETNKIQAAQLREILRGAKIDFEVDYSHGVDTPLPHLAEIKRMSLQLSETARQALHERDFGEAALDLGAEADMLRLLSQEPVLISSLVRIACARIAIGAAWEGLQRNGWNDAQLAALQAKWQQLNLFTNLDAVMAAERAFAIDALAKARHFTNVAQLSPFWGLTGPPPATPTFGDWLGELMKDPKAAINDAYIRYPKFWMWKSSWSYEEELCALQMITAEVEACRRIDTLNYCALTLGELPNQTSNILHSFPKSESHFMASYGYMDGPLHRGLVKSVQAEVSRQLLVTAIALERFHLRHSAWPDTLEKLVPDFLPQVPLDFMDGKPLRYRSGINGLYVLYSVGLDGKDDGGDPSPPPNETSFNNFGDMRDIVWPQPASPQQIQDFGKKHNGSTNALLLEAPPPAK